MAISVVGVGMPEGGPSFSSVRRARELLREKSLETYAAYMKLAEEAIKKGDLEIAEKIYRYVLDHTIDDDGTPLLGPSVDKPKEIESSGPKGPSITIGVAIGGLGQPKQLPEADVEIIDVRPESDDN